MGFLSKDKKTITTETISAVRTETDSRNTTLSSTRISEGSGNTTVNLSGDLARSFATDGASAPAALLDSLPVAPVIVILLLMGAGFWLWGRKT